MANLSLADAWEKLRWSRHHFEILRPQIESFEQAHDYTITVQVQPNTGEYIFNVIGLKPLITDWSMILGDCLHNARTALDYVMVRLVARVERQEPKDVESVTFPIQTDPEIFRSVTKKFRNDTSFSGYLARIEDLQPFNYLNESVWGAHGCGVPIALRRLSSLDNQDKHRIIHATWHGVPLPRVGPTGLPSGFKFLGSQTAVGPLEDNAEVARWTFETPLPSQWEPDQVSMKGYFPLKVCFDEPIAFKAVLEVLPFCLWGVEAVLGIFDPVFTHNHPPLPVTMIREWPTHEWAR